MTYRSEADALEHRREALEAQLRGLEARAKSYEALARTIDETRAALDELDRRRSANEAVRRLPLVELDRLTVASPCTVAWEAMQGDERVRFCALCAQHVYNLSAMTRTEAEAFVRERSGRACVRFYRRHDGTVRTTDCPVGVRRRRVRRAALAIAGATAVTAAALGALTALRSKREACARRAATVAVHAADHELNMPVMGLPPVIEPTAVAPTPRSGERLRTVVGRLPAHGWSHAHHRAGPSGALDGDSRGGRR